MAESSSEALAVVGLTENALALFHENASAESFIGKLSNAGLFADAVAYRAHTLAPEASVIWSLSCVRILQPDLKGAASEAIAAAAQWISERSDDHRRACKAAAEKAGLKTAAGCVAMAAFFAEGSVAPAERDHVPVPSGVAQKIAAGAIILAVVANPKQAADRFQQCLVLAR